MSKTPNNKILNARNIAFVLEKLCDGEKKRTELQEEFLAFSGARSKSNFDMLITSLTFKASIYESDDGYIGLLKNE